MTATTQAPAQVGEVRDIPLNRLKASPDNARRVGHSAETIESRAASIKAKGVLQPLVVKPETKEDGQETGYYFVSIGEGRRQALRLLAKRKVLGKAVPVRCVVDTTNDPAEISLDENYNRQNMHPADEFEAFRDLAERKGWGPEEISARFGPSPHVVRQRLRLGAVAPALLDIYREGGLNLDQVTAFAVNPDPERQMQVYARLHPHQRTPMTIRRAMTETKVAHDDRRAVFVGVDPYVAAGGAFLVDLFTEAGEGWVEDVALLDRLVAEKLQAEAQALQDQEGWKWSAAYVDFPQDHGWRRIWERVLPPSAEDLARREALTVERDALIDLYAEVDPFPDDVEQKIAEIEGELKELSGDYDFDPEEKARAGVFVVLTHHGDLRIERGYVRPEDEPPPPELSARADADEAGDQDEAAPFLADDGEPDAEAADEDDEPLGEIAAPLSPRVSADITAHRSAALRCALAEAPDLALTALTHALLLRVFRGVGGYASCLDVRMGSRNLASEGEGIEDSRAGRANAERHDGWARQVPDDPEAYWDFVVGLDLDSRMGLLAHCVSLTLDGVRGWESRPMIWKHADRLASALDLDMGDWWSPTAERFLGSVTKAHILGAVAEAVSPEAAERLQGLKKDAMIEAAQPQLVGARWLPSFLRTPGKALPWVKAEVVETGDASEANAAESLAAE